eukprot:514899-Karenia_brevis.AAC.1
MCGNEGGEWEVLTVTVDSGAADSVAPEDQCVGYATRSTAASKAGMNYIAANGKKIPNLGEKVISAVTQEGIETSMRFQICPVTKALGSVSRMTKNGHRV